MAGSACGTNGISLDGQRVSPRPVEEAQRLTLNAPSLDGQRVSLRPAEEAQISNCPDWACGTNGISLDGQRVDLQ